MSKEGDHPFCTKGLHEDTAEEWGYLDIALYNFAGSALTYIWFFKCNSIKMNRVGMESIPKTS